jgi:hypothetical protein
MNKIIVPCLSILFGTILFFALCFFAKDFKPGEVGLGLNTTPHKARSSGELRSGIEEVIDSAILNMDKANKSGHFSTALWMGNSQLHSINYYQTGDLLAMEYVQKRLDSAQAGVKIFQFSSPHLSLIEELVYVDEIVDKKIIPEILILPVTYRSFHFSNIRDELKRLGGYKNHDNFFKDAQLTELFKYEYENDTRGKLVSKTKTWQDLSEESINGLLDSTVPNYMFRNNVKSFVKYFPIYVHHQVVDLDKDRGIKGDARTVNYNILALEEILKFAKENGLKVILYQVPHPQDPDYFFYDRQAYKDFFETIEEKIKAYPNVYYMNLSKIIPLDLWGLSNDGVKDTYHFKAEGHQILADSIGNKIFEVIVKK